MHLYGILETALYGNNLNELADFYKSVFGFNEVARTEGRNVVLSCSTSALILFNPDVSIKKDGKFPYHGTAGPGHIAFLIKDEEQGKWREHLKNHKINIEKEINWEDGSTSIYLRDPADNSVELAPATLWNNLGRKMLSIE